MDITPMIKESLMNPVKSSQQETKCIQNVFSYTQTLMESLFLMCKGSKCALTVIKM
jgi:hypothetical protein